MSIRSTAKAIIVNNGKILLNRCYDKYNGEYFSLPGGGQNQYETLHEAIVRECLEETGYTVIPIRLAALCESICDSLEFREKYSQYSHKMFHIFLCEVADNEVVEPTEKDSMQLSTEWVYVDELNGTPIYPKLVGENISAIISGDCPVFLGSEHIPFNHG